MNRLLYKPPKLILVTGVAGSGKSLVTRKILDRVVATYIDKDTIQNPFTETRWGEYYTSIRRPCYDVMYKLALDNLQVGNTVIIDSPFIKEMQDQAWLDWLVQYFSSYLLKVVLCYAPEAVLQDRLKQRGNIRDLHRLANWEAILEKEPLKVEVPFGHIIVDTSMEIDLERILVYLGD